ncbi:MAG TPA: hypothetical protein VEL79_11985 [Vicinamibacterales bacterium]|nr:hypothetical protein [Vicinamibacterales bacterium]
MGLSGWLRRRPRGTDAGVGAWRAAWLDAVRAPDPDRLAALEIALRRAPPLADDLELEEEMLDGLRQLVALKGELDEGRLPRIDTTHRVVGLDLCHFSAPVSMPDDPAQPTGRLLLTSTRAVFAGGTRTPGLPWHAAREVSHDGRDLVLVRAGAEDGYRFRCNSFADALCGAAIARHLVQQRTTIIR